MTAPLSGRVCGVVGCNTLLTTREGKYCAACEARLKSRRKAFQAAKMRRIGRYYEQLKREYEERQLQEKNGR